jgi:hypothetical protein
MKSQIESKCRFFRSDFARQVIAKFAGLENRNISLVEPEIGIRPRLRIAQAMGEQIQQRQSGGS